MLLQIFLASAILTSMISAGLWAAFLPEYIFGTVGDLLEQYLPVWAFKPLIGCLTCMGSVWGTIGFYYLGSPYFSWWYWPWFVLAVTGLNVVALSIVQNFRKP